VPGGGSGAAGRPQRASLAADALRTAGHLFPYLPRQPGYHKRVKAAAPLDHLACLVPDGVQARHADPPLLGYAEDAQVEQRMWRAQRASAFATSSGPC
jgi:hypothetical protein